MNPTPLVIIGTYGSILLLYLLSRYISRRQHGKLREKLRLLEETKKPLKRLNDLEKEELPEEEEMTEEEHLSEAQIQDEDEGFE